MKDSATPKTTMMKEKGKYGEDLGVSQCKERMKVEIKNVRNVDESYRKDIVRLVHEETAPRVLHK